MTSLFDQIYNLYEHELYSNVKTLGQIVLTIYDNNRSTLSSEQCFATHLLIANSLYEEKNYNEAEVYYQKALIIRKQIEIRTENISNIIEKFSEVEIKYRIAKCFIENRQFKDAAAILQTLSIKQKTPKINMLLSKIFQESGNERSAVSHFREVLKICPYAFEAVEGLLSLGIKGTEVNSMVINASPCDLLTLWIKANSLFYARKYTDAIQTLKLIEATPMLRNFSQCLILIGECYYYEGEYELAYSYLKRAHKLNPYMQNGIQKFAMLLVQLNKSHELEEIIKPPSIFPYKSETWFVMAQYLLSVQKGEKAIYFVQKSCLLNKRNVDAMILKARILHHNKKTQESLLNMRVALKYEPFRFEVHRAIIEILLSTDKFREAQAQATKSLKQLGDSPRMLTLTASTYLKDNSSKQKAKTLLLKALELNEFYIKAILMLVDMLKNDNEFRAAIKLLEKICASVANVKLILMLAELYTIEKNFNSALEMYTKALNLDSTNRLAIQGLLSLGQSATPNINNNSNNNNNNNSATLDVSTADVQTQFKVNNDSDSEETELVWSDIEIMDAVRS